MNAPIQGSSADLIKVAMNHVYEALKEKQYKSKIILQIHDELILDVTIDEVEEIKELVQNEMQHAMKLSVPLIAEASVGKSWFDTK